MDVIGFYFLLAQFFLQDECVEILNQVVCEYEHMWTKTLGEMTASVLAIGDTNHQYMVHQPSLYGDLWRFDGI